MREQMSANGSTSSLVVAITVALVGVAVAPAPSLGQACNGVMQITNQMLQTPNVNGSIDTVRITIGAGAIDPTGSAPNPMFEVSQVFFKLDCDTANLLACPDDGTVIAYVTNPVVTTCGVTWTATTNGTTPHPGGSADNTVIFVASSPVVIPPNQGDSCYLEFQVQVSADRSNDGTPFVAEQLAGYQMATCTNGGVSAAANSSGVPIARAPLGVSRVPAPAMDPRALGLLAVVLAGAGAQVVSRKRRVN